MEKFGFTADNVAARARIARGPGQIAGGRMTRLNDLYQTGGPEP